MLVKAIREAVDVPVHLHMHDTSGNGIASYRAAVDAGVAIIDCAVGSMSGMPSQPSLESLLFALEGSPRDPRIDPAPSEKLSVYWDTVRDWYAPFEGEARKLGDLSEAERTPILEEVHRLHGEIAGLATPRRALDPSRRRGAAGTVRRSADVRFGPRLPRLGVFPKESR